MTEPLSESLRAFAVNSVTRLIAHPSSVTVRFPGWVPQEIAVRLTESLAERLRPDESPAQPMLDIDDDTTECPWLPGPAGGYVRHGAYGVSEYWLDCGDWGTCVHVRVEYVHSEPHVARAIESLAESLCALYCQPK